MRKFSRDNDGWVEMFDGNCKPCLKCKSTEVGIFEIVPPGKGKKLGKRVKRCFACGNEYAVCGAKRFRSEGVPCEQRPVKDPDKPHEVYNNRCRIHGGKCPRGIKSARFKDGRYKKGRGDRFSRGMPEKLLRKYEEAVADQQLLEGHREVALLDVRIQECKRRLDSGESGAAWLELETLYHEVQNASSAEEMQSALIAMGKIIVHKVDKERAWNELADAIKDKTHVASAEHRRLKDMQQLITVQEMLTMMSFLGSSIKQHVEDPKTKTRIGKDFARVMSFQRDGVPAIVDVKSTPGGKADANGKPAGKLADPTG